MLDLPFFLFNDSIRSLSDLSGRFPQGVDPPSIRFIQMQSLHLKVFESRTSDQYDPPKRMIR